jgi:putative spermidine/putrescine transport system permease protein
MARRRDLDTVSFYATISALTGLGLVLLIAPTLVVLIVSFTSGSSLRFPPPGFSLKWYAALGDAWQIKAAAWNSVEVALWTTVLSVLLGVSASLAIARSRSATAHVLDSLFMSPLVLPALAFGLSALMFFSLIGWAVSPLTLVLGHTVVCVPYVVRTTVGALTQLDAALLEGSASLGAGRWYTFRRVTLPLIRPGILAGGFIAFMSSFDNIPVSLFLRGADSELLPIRMWQDLDNRLDVTIAAVSGVWIAFTAALMVAMERFASLSRRLR